MTHRHAGNKAICFLDLVIKCGAGLQKRMPLTHSKSQCTLLLAWVWCLTASDGISVPIWLRCWTDLQGAEKKQWETKRKWDKEGEEEVTTTNLEEAVCSSLLARRKGWRDGQKVIGGRRKEMHQVSGLLLRPWMQVSNCYLRPKRWRKKKVRNTPVKKWNPFQCQKVQWVTM